MKHNILYFSSFGSMKGGGQRSLYYIVSGLDRDIFNPIVVCPAEEELVINLQKIGIETVVFPFKRFRQLSISFILKLLRLLRDKKISIVHTDDPTQSFYAGIAAKLYGIPLIWHVRVSSSNFLMDRLIPYLCSKLILVADSLRDRFYWLESTGKLITVHNAIDIEEFDSIAPVSIREETGIPRNVVLIGCIGRIEEMKGQIYLAEAVGKINREADNFKILLIGAKDSKYYKKLDKLIKELELEKFFVCTGYRNDTLGIVKNIDLLVLPSSFGEGLSRVILEAMAAGKPVIATDVGGNKEAVIDGVNGRVVPPGDSEALSHAILDMLKSPANMKEMGANGRRKVAMDFSINDNIRKIEDTYNMLLKLRLN